MAARKKFDLGWAYKQGPRCSSVAIRRAFLNLPLVIADQLSPSGMEVGLASQERSMDMDRVPWMQVPRTMAAVCFQ